jgi:hypothetical protein
MELNQRGIANRFGLLGQICAQLSSGCSIHEKGRRMCKALVYGQGA